MASVRSCRSRAQSIAAGLCLGAALLAFSGLASAQTTVTFKQGVSPSGAYAGTSDVVIVLPDTGDLQQDPNANYNDDDGFDNDVDGHTAKKQPLMRWNVSSIAPGSVVNAVTIRLFITDPATSTNDFDFYELLRPWDVNQVTWNNARDGDPWAVPGARGSGTDRDGTSLGNFIGTVDESWVDVPLNATGVAAVQRWIDNPAQNFGIITTNLWISDMISWDDSSDALGNPPILQITHSGGTVAEFQHMRIPTFYGGYVDTVIARGPTSGSMDGAGLGLATGVSNPLVSLILLRRLHHPHRRHRQRGELAVQRDQRHHECQRL